MMYTLSKNTLFILSRLEENGFEAYVVGGCVRDMLMGKIPDDEDITTNATPEQTKAVFSDFNVIETGIKHGTVSVIIDHTPYEITTFRTEGTYTDGRHPDSVTFTRNIKDDLSRRDFTINSIAYNPHIGFIDPFGGSEDIKAGVVRCVGEPVRRFSEDSLRILRGLRFSSVLGFSIEEETQKAMLECTPLLKNVSCERVFVELKKMLCGKDIRRILTQHIDVLAFVLPEIKAMKGFEQHNFHHIYDVLTHTAVATQSIAPVPHLRLAALFHDCGKPDTFFIGDDGIGHFYAHAAVSASKVQDALNRLKCDTATKQKVITLIKLHDTPIELSEKIIKRRLCSLGEELFFDLIALQRADNLAQAPEFLYRQKHFDDIESLTREIIAKQQCFSLKDLAVNGKDFISLGVQGKDIGTALNMLLDAVMDGKVKNEKAALLEYYNKISNK